MRTPSDAPKPDTFAIAEFTRFAADFAVIFILVNDKRLARFQGSRSLLSIYWLFTDLQSRGRVPHGTRGLKQLVG